MENVEEIKDFVDSNSYFTLDYIDDDSLMFATRENGCVGSETASDEDWIEGLQLVELLKGKFNVDCTIDSCDEWVNVEVTNKKIEIDVFKYKFKKDFEGCGFTDTFESMEKLIERFGTWIKVDWDAIIDKVKAIDSFPNNNYTGDYDSTDYLISSRGDDGNNWGYNFYIIKNREKVLVDSK
jgi:hypothetical protein